MASLPRIDPRPPVPPMPVTPRASFARWWVPAPPAGPGVCSVCHGPTRPRFTVCFCCTAVARSLGRPLATVVPISACRVPGPLHALLRNYKDGRIADERADAVGRLSMMLSDFLDAHRPCLEVSVGGTFDMTIAVPSSIRPGDAPLHSLRVPVWTPNVLVRGPGAIRHLSPSVEAYAVAGDAAPSVAGRRVLLIDDTLTTGAHVQSAAAVLRRAGAGAIGVLVLGRAVRPEVHEHGARYWRATVARARSDRCCLPTCQHVPDAPAASPAP